MESLHYEFLCFLHLGISLSCEFNFVRLGEISGLMIPNCHLILLFFLTFEASVFLRLNDCKLPDILLVHGCDSEYYWSIREHMNSSRTIVVGVHCHSSSMSYDSYFQPTGSLLNLTDF